MAQNSMINNHMDSQEEQKQQAPAPVQQRPNESSGIYVRGFVKITDPDSGEVIVETAN